MKSTGVTAEMIKIEPEVVDFIINQYCREPGIRSLEKITKKIIEKVSPHKPKPKYLGGLRNSFQKHPYYDSKPIEHRTFNRTPSFLLLAFLLLDAERGGSGFGLH
jgi:ATP-dependent Lon protease